MSDIKDIITFEGSGLDLDSDLLAIKRGDSRYRFNVTTSFDGKSHVISSIAGDNQKAIAEISQGNNKVVGAVTDEENDAVIFFVYNDEDNHSIIRYNFFTNDYDYVMCVKFYTTYYTDLSVLNMPSNGYIDAGLIGSGSDQYLVWADGDFLKIINVQKAIDEEYNAVLEENEIRFYKKPYTGNLVNVYYYDSAYDYNHLKGKIFQFSVRYRYFDKTYSTISPISRIALPSYENFSNGRLSNKLANNYIRINISDIADDISFVEKYQLLYRVVDIGDGVPGTWNIYAEEEISASSNIIDFYNDKSLGIIDDSEAARPYDYVPDKVNHIGIINSNIIVCDVAEEGFDNIEISNTEAPEVVVTDNAISDAETDYEDYVSIATGSDETFTYVKSSNTIDQDWIFTIGDNGTTISSYGFTSNEMFGFLVDYISGLSISSVYGVAGTNSITITNGSGSAIESSLLIIGSTPTYRALYPGSKYKLGIRYGYNGRIGPVQFHDDLAFETLSRGDSYDGYQTANVKLYHQAPEGATDYQLVSFGSDVDYCESYLINGYHDTPYDGESIDSITLYLDGTDTVIKRDEMVNYFLEAYSDGINYGFDIAVGDEVVFMSAWKTGLSAGLELNMAPYYYTDDLRFKIKSVTSSEIRLDSSALYQLIDKTPSYYSASGFVILIQIIRRKKTFSAVSQEFSKVFQITDRNHGGDVTQVYSSSTPAEVYLNDYFCDCWVTKQVFMNYRNASSYGRDIRLFCADWIEKPMVSLYYDSYPVNDSIPSFGRLNAINVFSEKKSYNKIRWSGKFLSDSGVNFINKFEYNDEAYLDDRNGSITKIQQIGDTLKVYQERKVTSFYLNKKSSTDSNGNTAFYYSDDIIDPDGGAQSAFDNGCTNFESYAKNIRNAYFFDLVNATVVRDSPAGLEEISKYGMSSYFKNKADEILTIGKNNVRILGAYDFYNDWYVISFICESDGSISDSVAFHEPSNRWVSFLSLPDQDNDRYLDFYGMINGQTYVGFTNYSGGLSAYVKNTNLYSIYFGVVSENIARVHCNINPNLIKVWDSIEIVSTGQWSPYESGDVKVNVPIEQQSRLKAGKFELQEGEYRSEFMKDMLSGESSVQENNLFNGDELRGYDLTVDLRFTDYNSQGVLRMVKINGSSSL